MKMAQKRQSNKKEKGVLKKRPQLKEIPQPTKLLLGMAFAIIIYTHLLTSIHYNAFISSRVSPVILSMTSITMPSVFIL